MKLQRREPIEDAVRAVIRDTAVVAEYLIIHSVLAGTPGVPLRGAISMGASGLLSGMAGSGI